MRHFGDITKIKGAEVPPVNVIIGGSPCQDLSVAGRRAGLAGERSGLFMEQIRLIKEMRKADADKGRTGIEIRPRFMVWENVPGAFSSNKGADFGAVLQETIRVVEEAPAVPMPKYGWPMAGCLYGAGGAWSVAWRVCDAQFWGTPQRRRRIALIADFGGMSAPEILFEREGVYGDSQESETERQGATAPAESSSALYDCEGTEYAPPVLLKIRSGCEGGGKGPLMQVDKSATLACNNDQYLFQPVVEGLNGYNAALTGDKSSTLGVNCGMSTGRNGAVICLQGNGGESYTLNTVDPAAVYAVENHPQDSRVTVSEEGIVQTLSGKMGTGGGNTPLILSVGIGRDAFNSGKNAQFAMSIESEVQPPLVAKGPGAVAAVDFRNFTEDADINGTLQAKPNGGTSLNLNNVVRVRYIVRRLTPLECERLQGFPDGWTDIGEWTDTQGKIHKDSSDSARYKALGNSIALPSWFYLLKKLSLCCVDKSMASLFDGIGGFPLIWETLNGKGSCRWASEIEEFPIAVTKARFPDPIEGG